jgi:hypothetical protein
VFVVQFDTKHRPGQHRQNTPFDLYMLFHEERLHVKKTQGDAG